MTLEVRSTPTSSSPKYGVRLLQLAAVALFAIVWWRASAWLDDERRENEAMADIRVLEPEAISAETALGIKVVEVVIRSGDTLDRLFRRLELPLGELAALRSVTEIRQRLDRLRPGDVLRLGIKDGQIVSLERKLSLTETLKVQRTETGFQGEILFNPLERALVTTEGIIDSSLFQAASTAGLSDAMALRIAEIFRWDIDFVLDIRPGDRFRVTYEQLSQDGERVGEDEPLAVEFVNRGKSYRAVRYSLNGAAPLYFTPEGESLRKAFLRSPVDFSRISSRFNLFRRHPVLNTIRAHRGVDYAAPTGTPVKAAGAGRVAFVGTKGGYGKVVEIQHANAVKTLYGHLSNFARGLRQGARVDQGQVIGYVGMTGLATGPHLHYEYLVRGKHQDPLRVTLPNDQPIPPAQMPAFRAHAEPLLASLAQLDPTPVLLAREAAAAPSPAVGR
jgi:murein DD-endopeptidase MepM/ murein hydrolase activator NlpD